ncbi:MAG TPA: response regulator, partial [Verrucomicrobiae bacterium]|nr:response regulator [Verrucomicrobiae bacterium]
MKEKRRILVVEDEIPLAMMMVSLLTRAGYEVEAACNAEKAVQLAKNVEFDLITLDLNMPDGSGFEIFRSLKQLAHLRDTPVVFVTSCATPENQLRAFEIG